MHPYPSALNPESKEQSPKPCLRMMPAKSRKLATWSVGCAPNLCLQGVLSLEELGNSCILPQISQGFAFRARLTQAGKYSAKGPEDEPLNLRSCPCLPAYADEVED